MMYSRARMLSATALAGLLSAPAFGAAPDAVLLWNANAGAAATRACIVAQATSDDDDPFHEGRAYAMMHIAIHDALNAIKPTYQQHTFTGKAQAGTSPDAAVAGAAHDVLVHTIRQLPSELVKQDCIDAGVASTEAAYKAALADIPNGAAREQGIALGQASAKAIIEARANDQADKGPFLNMNCPAPQPGRYQCTPGLPEKFIAFEAWEKVTPFVLQNAAQFRPGPPYAISDPKFQKDLDEVKRLGGNGTTTPSARTEDQTQIALFWMESSPLKWSRIARDISRDKSLNAWENARLFAILNMALADGYIAMAWAKNHYDFWRPITAIQSGDDPSWTPFQVTPADQDYPSGHSIEGGVGAEVLKRFFGTDSISFKDCGMLLPNGSSCSAEKPVLRTYQTFTQAADENGFSRVLIGFHFRQATEVGTAYGRKIGERAAALLPAVK